MSPRRARPILALLAAAASAAAGGCAATIPLSVTNQSTAPVTADLVAFPEGGDNARDWDDLLEGVTPLRPGERTSWRRRATGVRYLLAIAGPGLRGPRGYSLFTVPDAPLTITIRGDEQHVGVWVDGHPPVLLRP